MEEALSEGSLTRDVAAGRAAVVVTVTQDAAEAQSLHGQVCAAMDALAEASQSDPRGTLALGQVSRLQPSSTLSSWRQAETKRDTKLRIVEDILSKPHHSPSTENANRRNPFLRRWSPENCQGRHDRQEIHRWPLAIMRNYCRHALELSGFSSMVSVK